MNPEKTKIQQALALLFQPGETIELRSVGDRVGNGYYRDHSKLIDDAIALSNAELNAYVCLNPVDPQLYARRQEKFDRSKKGECTSDHDIQNRRWLLIDIDPVRPAGVSATEQQKQAAFKLSESVFTFLKQQLGAGCLVVADSGNGAHILVRLQDVPANAEATWISEKFLQLLDQQFSNDDARIDLTTFNASRICTLYGTVKRKGINTTEQPHRVSGLVHVPDPIENADWATIKVMVGQYPGEKQNSAVNNGSAWNIKLLLDQRQICYTSDDAYRTENGETASRFELNVCPFNALHDDRSAYLIQFQSGAVSFGCHHDGCNGKDWQALKSIWQLPVSSGINVADIILPSIPAQPPLQNNCPAPVAPAGAFYGPLGELVLQFAPHTEASPIAMLITLLTHYGNAIGRRYYVDIGTRQYLKLFTALAGSTSRGRKWTAEENVCHMIDAINPAWADYRHSGLASGEGMLQAVANNMDGIYPAPAIFTEGEFALVLRKKERKGNSLDGYIRVAFDDAVLSTATRKDPLRVEGSHISLLVHITPGELNELLTSRDVSNGFANRFLWCWSCRPGRVHNAKSFEAEVAYRPHIETLQQAFDRLQQRYQGQPIRLQLDYEAKAKWPDIYAYLDNVESDEDEGLLVDLNARAPAIAQRIAGIFALADGASEIGIRHLVAAVAITDYSLATVDYIFSRRWATNNGRDLELVKQRANRVISELPIGQAINRSHVSHTICNRNRSSAELDQIRDFLVASGSLSISQTEKAEQWTRLN